MFTAARRGERACFFSQALLTASSLLAIAVSDTSAASAAGGADQPQQVETAQRLSAEPSEPNQIVVIGNRAIVASLEDVPVEDTYDEDRVASYGVDSVGELLDTLRGENGDDEPTLLVNGRPVNDAGDISSFPVEAIRRVEALPRGSASRVGGLPGQRAYNIVLKTSLKSLTLTASGKTATEGGWHELRGDATATYIKGQDRLNLTARATGSDALLQSDRGIVPVAPTYPYSALGNVIAFSGFGSEIDPALSLVAGTVVTQAGVPAGIARPSLAQIAAAPLNSTDVTRFRSLRGDARNYDVSVAGNKTLAPWLSLSFNGRLGWTSDERLNGLPTARALVPVTNSFTPFSRSVLLALTDQTRPLVNTSKSDSLALSATLNVTWGDWRGTVAAKYDKRSRAYAYQLTDAIAGGFLTIDPLANPFAGGLGALIPVTTRLTTSQTTVSDFQADLEGPVFNLPAGPLRLRVGAGTTWLGSSSDSISGMPTEFSRRELEGRAGLSVPLASRTQGPVRGLGDLEFTVDVARSDLGQFGSLEGLSLALNWQPLAWLRLSVSQRDDERSPAPELISSPTLITENVPYFDPVTGETVDVTTISGGAGNLRNERQRIRQVSLNATPWKKYNLQLNADFRTQDVFNQFGGLPLPTPAVVAAFPERFQRDARGRLVLVDNRTVNFAQQRSSELRTGFAFTIPLFKAPVQPVRRVRGAPVSRSRPTMQVTASHTHLFSNSITIRDALGSVDLLAGNAVGLGGGRQRDTIDASVTLSDRGTGVRASMAWRGPSTLAIGTAAAPDRLRFSAYTRFDLKLYADLANLFGRKGFAKGSRVTLAVDNVFNHRQSVFDSGGLTPLGYQPAYRDAVGRTVMLELRKVF